MDKSCFDCKFFDGWCCMYDFAARSLLNEEDAAMACDNYTKGYYDEESLAETDYK